MLRHSLKAVSLKKLKSLLILGFFIYLVILLGEAYLSIFKRKYAENHSGIFYANFLKDVNIRSTLDNPDKGLKITIDRLRNSDSFFHVTQENGDLKLKHNPCKLPFMEHQRLGFREHDFSRMYQEKVPPFLMEDFKSVKKLLLFVGWPRSCNSFVGSLLDGHPHMVIGDEFGLLRRLQAGKLNMSTESILKELYYSSWCGSVSGLRARAEHAKGYSLIFTDLLQGKYEDHVDVIGDKFGGGVSKDFTAHSEAFVDTLRELRKTLDIPIYAIRVVRNPFDNIATIALYSSLRTRDVRRFKELSKRKKLFSHPFDLNSTTRLYFQLYTASEQVVSLVDKAVDVHCSDLITNPREEIVKLCKFLDIECSEDYISKCVSHVFTEESHTSALIGWPLPVLKYLKEAINSISTYKRYNTSLSSLNPLQKHKH